MMPHPERCSEEALGRRRPRLFDSMVAWLKEKGK
jgi:phosphoribosylformylglycinamidine (FGAM) synthase-like amidotransferase family enzyme